MAGGRSGGSDAGEGFTARPRSASQSTHCSMSGEPVGGFSTLVVCPSSSEVAAMSSPHFREQPTLRPRSPLAQWAPAGAVVAVVGLVVVAASTSHTGATKLRHGSSFLGYSAGVICLVALTATVVWGLVSADRRFRPAHRFTAQAVHGALAILAVGFLAVHIVLKVGEKHAKFSDAVVPFLASPHAPFVGMGTIAGDLLVLIVATGMLRGAFAGRRPWLWRAVHATAYACWPLAIIHGLKAGRHAATYVNASYIVCVVLVFGAAIHRLF